MGYKQSTLKGQKPSYTKFLPFQGVLGKKRAEARLQHPFFLQQRRKQSYNTLEQSFQERAPYEIRHIIHQNAAGFILQINPLDSLRHFLIIEEGIRLEIILETPEIHIRAAHGTEVVIAHQQLAVIESTRIEIDLHASLYRLHQIRTRSPLHHPGI